MATAGMVVGLMDRSRDMSPDTAAQGVDPDWKIHREQRFHLGLKGFADRDHGPLVVILDSVACTQEVGHSQHIHAGT